MASSQASEQPDPFLESLATVCTAVALADGTFDASEIQEIAGALSEFLESRYGADGPPSEDVLHDIFGRAETRVRSHGPEAALHSASASLPKTQRLHILSVAASTIAADGKVTVGERVAFEAAARALGLEDLAKQFLTVIRDQVREAKRDETVHVIERLEQMGWSEPEHDDHTPSPAVVTPSRRLVNDAGCTLRVEHHDADRSLHYRMIDEAGIAHDVVIYHGDHLDDVLSAITNAQRDLSTRTLSQHIDDLVGACPERVFVFRNGELVRTGQRPSKGVPRA